MVTIQFFLKNPKSRVSPIYIAVHVKGKRLTPISIGISVNCDSVDKKGKPVKGDWDKDKQRVRKSHDFADEINFRIEDIYLNVGRQFLNMLHGGKLPTNDDLQLLVKPGTTRKKKGSAHTVLEYYEKFKETILEKENRGNENWKLLPYTKQKGYTYTKQPKPLVDKLEEFKPGISLRELVPSAYEREQGTNLMDKFFDWLDKTYPGKFQDTTLRSYVVAIRRLLKFANLPYDWVEMISGGKATKYALTRAELFQIRDTRYSRKDIADAADIAIIISQLALRWGDFSNLQPNHFIQVETQRHGTVWCIDKNQNKTNNPVLVPAPPMAEALLKKHNFVLPLPRTKEGFAYRHYLADLMKDAAKEAKLERQIRLTKTYKGKVEEYWKPLYDLLSPHDLRHTGATLIRRATKDNNLVKRLLGHSPSGNSVTDDYIHLDPLDAVDDLLDAWKKIEAGS